MRTNLDLLKPNAAPDVYPWRFIKSRQLSKWLNVSHQTLANWRLRGTGPRCGKDREGRCHYRLCDVLSWLGRGERSPGEICREFVAERFPALAPKMPDADVDVVFWAEFQDKSRAFDPKNPGRFPKLKFEEA